MGPIGQCRLDLTHDHMIATLLNLSSGEVNISFFDLRSSLKPTCEDRWLPLPWILPDYGTNIKLKTNLSHEEFQKLLSFSIHRSPLHADVSRVWLIVKAQDPRRNQAHRYLVYRVNLNINNPGSRLAPVSPLAYLTNMRIVDAFDTSRGSDLSYSGHFINWESDEGRPHVFSASSSRKAAYLRDVPRSVDSADITPYSGTVIFFTKKNIVVRYDT